METVRYLRYLQPYRNTGHDITHGGRGGGEGGEFLGKKSKLTKMYGQKVELSLVNQYTNVSTTES